MKKTMLIWVAIAGLTACEKDDATTESGPHRTGRTSAGPGIGAGQTASPTHGGAQTNNVTNTPLQ